MLINKQTHKQIYKQTHFNKQRHVYIELNEDIKLLVLEIGRVLVIEFWDGIVILVSERDIVFRYIVYRDIYKDIVFQYSMRAVVDRILEDFPSTEQD